MHLIRARNAHSALPLGLRYLEGYGASQRSRGGDVIVAPGPVVTEYTHPCERVIL